MTRAGARWATPHRSAGRAGWPRLGAVMRQGVVYGGCYGGSAGEPIK
jgi:hypothetical protein